LAGNFPDSYGWMHVVLGPLLGYGFLLALHRLCCWLDYRRLVKSLRRP
jgi:hypothetical protein